MCGLKIECQQSEWSALRGQLLEKQALQAAAAGANCSQFEEQANVAYADSTRQGQSTFAKGWINWGLYCDRRMQEQQRAEKSGDKS